MSIKIRANETVIHERISRRISRKTVIASSKITAATSGLIPIFKNIQKGIASRMTGMTTAFTILKIVLSMDFCFKLLIKRMLFSFQGKKKIAISGFVKVFGKNTTWAKRMWRFFLKPQRGLTLTKPKGMAITLPWKGSSIRFSDASMIFLEVCNLFD